jgi:hypothetical protein
MGSDLINKKDAVQVKLCSEDQRAGELYRDHDQRVYAQTSFYQENLAFCFQLCTVTHFVGFLLLPWFSCSLVFFP